MINGSQRVDSVRKAAILIANLDEASADILLDQLSDEQAAQVRRAVVELNNIPDFEKQKVVEDFLNGRRSETGNPQSALGYANTKQSTVGQEATRVGSEALPKNVTEGPASSSAIRAQLELATTQDLVRFVASERPQTATILLSQLPRQTAADLVMQLPKTIRLDLLRRLARLETAAPDVVEEVIHHANEKLVEGRSRDGTRAGIDSLKNILGAITPDQRRELAAELVGESMDLGTHAGAQGNPHQPESGVASNMTSSQCDVPSSEAAGTSDATDRSTADARREAKSAPVISSSQTYENLPQETPWNPDWPSLGAVEPGEVLALFDDSLLLSAVINASNDVAALALTGADDALTERILDQLPPRTAQALEHAMNSLGPLRLRDIEHAQAQLASLARQSLPDSEPSPSTNQTLGIA